MAAQAKPALDNERSQTKNSAERHYLTEEQVRRFMSVIKSPRDRAMFAVVYWRRLRASEIGMLPLSAYNRRAKTLVTRKGVVPLSRFEVRTLNAWLKVRDGQKPWQIINNKPGALFLSRQGRGVGKGVERAVIAHLMKKYGKLAKLPMPLCRSDVLRHSGKIHTDQRVVEIQQGFFAARRRLDIDSMSAAALRKRVRELERKLDKVLQPQAQPAAPSATPTDPIAERAARRQAVVMPILKRKRWKRGRLASEAGTGKMPVYGYLDGKRAWISEENRKAIADALDLKPHDLPV